MKTSFVALQPAVAFDGTQLPGSDSPYRPTVGSISQVAECAVPQPRADKDLPLFVKDVESGAEKSSQGCKKKVALAFAGIAMVTTLGLLAWRVYASLTGEAATVSALPVESGDAPVAARLMAAPEPGVGLLPNPPSWLPAAGGPRTTTTVSPQRMAQWIKNQWTMMNSLG